MTARSIRRALERKQTKLARKTGQQNSSAAAARLAANRENAQLSTGPTSPEGKAKSSLNAIKTGLTGRTVLLSTDETAAYQSHLAAFEEEYRPAGLRECELVQSISDTFWRLARIPALEMALFAKGRIEFADLFKDHEPEVRPLLIDAHTFLVYEKQIRNLQLQESRLVRRREKETAELHALQQLRKQREMHEMQSAAKLYLAAKEEGKPFEPAELGFEFSNQDVEHFLARAASAKTGDTAMPAAA
jgi:hypothetical protein